MPKNQTSFKKGEIHNPKGRPPAVRAIRALLMAKAPEHIKALEELAMSTDDDKLAASIRQWLVEHGIGKAPQAVTGPDGEPLTLVNVSLGSLSTEQLEQLDGIRRALRGEGVTDMPVLEGEVT
jgi:hypothetical protein